MSLAEALEQEANAPANREACSIRRLLASLPEPEAGALLRAFASDMKHSAVARALARQEIRIAAATIGRHRNGLCSCDAR